MSDINRESITIYFNENVPLDMAIYHFLRSSPRKKSKFVIKLIEYFLINEGISDPYNLSEKMCCRIIEDALYTKLSTPSSTFVKPLQNISETELQYIVKKIISSLPKESDQSNIGEMPYGGNEKDKKENQITSSDNVRTTKPIRTNYFLKNKDTNDSDAINHSSNKEILLGDDSLEMNLPDDDDDDIGADWQQGMQMFNSI